MRIESVRRRCAHRRCMSIKNVRIEDVCVECMRIESVRRRCAYRRCMSIEDVCVEASHWHIVNGRCNCYDA